MRGATELIIAIILLLVGIIIVVTIYGIFNIFSVSQTSQSPTPITYNDNFNYTTYLLDKNPVNLAAYDECKKLMSAIGKAIVNKVPEQVDEISYGTENDFDNALSIALPTIGDCPDYTGEEILTNIASGLEQKVCSFVSISNTFEIGDSGDPNFGGLSHSANLYFDNCSYVNSRSIPLVIKGNVGPDEDINHNPFETNLYYSPDYFYIRDGIFRHSSSPNDATDFLNAYNGAGRLKIYVGKTSFSNGQCIFNVYFCPRTALGKTQEDDTVNIFNIFRYLETFNLLVNPYYIRDVTGSTIQMSDYSRKVSYWNYYNISLEKEYRVENIINAIKEGLYISIAGRGYSWAQPHWDIEKDPSLTVDNECWNTNYNDMIKDGSDSKRTVSIRFNCGGSNKCNGNLVIKISLRRDFKDINNNQMLENNENYVSGVISFCNQ